MTTSKCDLELREFIAVAATDLLFSPCAMTCAFDLTEKEDCKVNLAGWLCTTTTTHKHAYCSLRPKKKLNTRNPVM